jgi:hypothetical protein
VYQQCNKHTQAHTHTHTQHTHTQVNQAAEFYGEHKEQVHCCHTVVTLLLHCWYTVGTLLVHYCYTVVTLQVDGAARSAYAHSDQIDSVARTFK